jgi:spore coat protein CotH
MPAEPSGFEEGQPGTPGSGASTPPPTTPRSIAPGAGGPLYEPDDDATYVFDQSELRTYDILIAREDLAIIDANPVAEEWVPARMIFEGEEYGPFMARYKGGKGAFRPPCTMAAGEGPKTGKCSIKLGFDEVDENLRFYGLKSLNFHSMNNDASFLRDRLGYSLFRDFDVAAPRAVHARVLVNGEFQGLFGVVEQIDGRFTRARFPDGGKGNVYKEVWPVHAEEGPYLWQLKTNEDEDPSVANMVRFYEAIQEGTRAAEAFLDRDYMLRYLAADRVTTNDDGIFHFFCKPDGTQDPFNHNYYWYESASEALFWLIPWDFDQSFHSSSWSHIQTEWSAQAECSCQMVRTHYQYPASCDPLVSRFIDWLPDYETQVDAFIEGPYARAQVQHKLDTWVAQIEPVVRAAASSGIGSSYETWMSAVGELEDEVELTRAHRGAPY